MMRPHNGVSFIGFILFSALLALTATKALAQTPVSVSDDDVNRVASQLYCPVCENVTLDVCPTEACSRWRTMIRGKLALGWSDQQVMDFFVSEYGARVTGIPPKAGISLMLYVIPPFAAGALLVGAFFIARKYRSAAPKVTAKSDAPTLQREDYRKKLKDDLKKDI